MERLAYVQLWGLDAGLSLQRTAAIVSSTYRTRRNSLIDQSIDEITHRIEQLTEARDALQHLRRCPHDHPITCRVTSVQVRRRVDAALQHLSSKAADPD